MARDAKLEGPITASPKLAMRGFMNFAMITKNIAPNFTLFKIAVTKSLRTHGQDPWRANHM